MRREGLAVKEKLREDRATLCHSSSQIGVELHYSVIMEFDVAHTIATKSCLDKEFCFGGKF